MNATTSTDGAKLLALKTKPSERTFPKYFRYFWSAFFMLLLILFIGSLEPGIPPRHAWNAIEAQRVLLITKAMLQYAEDHQGKYPSGKSSTEIFQKLLEGGYLSNQASVFYFPVKGKTPALDGHLLKPENVSFDVTIPADTSDSTDLPLVFSTGFKVSYEPGASAKRLAPLDFRWPGFELFRPDPGPRHGYIIVGYKQPEVRTFLVTDDATNPNGSARGFIPSSFNANGKTYLQLTPYGPLPDN